MAMDHKLNCSLRDVTFNKVKYVLVIVQLWPKGLSPDCADICDCEINNI